MLFLEVLKDFRPNNYIIEVYAFYVFYVKLMFFKLLIKEISIYFFIFI
jgi:hypothetical protein